MVSKLKANTGFYNPILFINYVMEPTSKGVAPTADWVWNDAEQKGMEFPQIGDGTKKLRKAFSCSSLPMNLMVDLTSMKVIFAECTSSTTKMEAAIKSHFGY